MKKLIIAFLILGTSCTRIPYTSKIQNELSELGVKPREVQFFLSQKVVLITNRQEKTKEIQAGEIEIKKTITRERIVFGKFFWTKLTGICTNFGEKNYYVQFEEGDAKTKSLKFAYDSFSDKYILASDDSQNLDYEGAKYHIEIGKTAHLAISKKAYTKYNLTTRRVKGIKVGN